MTHEQSAPMEPFRAVTMQDVADRCNVSVATVSRALRHQGVHSPETTKRIREVAAAMGYDPNYHQGARRMVLRRFGKRLQNHLIAVVMPQYYYKSPYFTTLYHGILDVITPENYGVITVQEATQESTNLPPGLNIGDVDGVIFFATSMTHRPLMAQICAVPSMGNCPLVSVMSSGPGHASVQVDFVNGGQIAVAALFDKGHRHVLHFRREGSHPFLTYQKQQVQGYRQACQAYSLDPAASLHTVTLRTSTWDLAYRPQCIEQLTDPALIPQIQVDLQRLETVLREHPEITAILAPNDGFALLIWNMLRHLGRRVPEDYSLIGFDDIHTLNDEHGHSILATIRLPLTEVGREAARLTMEQIRREQVLHDEIILPCTLVPRASLGTPRA